MYRYYSVQQRASGGFYLTPETTTAAANKKMSFVKNTGHLPNNRGHRYSWFHAARSAPGFHVNEAERPVRAEGKHEQR